MDYDHPLIPEGSDDEIKFALHVEPEHVMNVYFGDLPGNDSGYAYYAFPATYPELGFVEWDEDDWWWGFTMDYTVAPGGSHPEYGLG